MKRTQGKWRAYGCQRSDLVEAVGLPAAWNCEIYAERGRAAVLIRYVRLLGTKNGCQAGRRVQNTGFWHRLPGPVTPVG